MATIHGDLLWCDGGWPSGCHEHELLALLGIGEVLDATEPRSSPGRPRVSWAGQDPCALARPEGTGGPPIRLTDPERAHNRDQAGLRALVEQAIGHLTNAWSLRRWSGLLYPVRHVFRAAPLISLGRWLQRIPT